MPFLIDDNSYGNGTTEVNTLEEVFDYFRDEEVADRNYRGDHPDVYEIVRKVEIVANPATFSVANPSTDIPAPLPGETVSDYARRISGG